MDDTSLLAEVELMSGLGRPEAKQAVRATLETLAELLGATERKALAAELPPWCGRYLRAAAEAPAQFGVDEFLRRVAEREHVDGRTARTQAIAVFAALGAAISNDLLSQRHGKVTAATGTSSGAPVGRLRAARTATNA